MNFTSMIKELDSDVTDTRGPHSHNAQKDKQSDPTHQGDHSGKP